MTDPSQQNPGEPSAAQQSPSEALRDLLASHGDGELRCVELCPICRAADVLRATAPDDIKDQWQAVQREALLTMKAAIDRYVERLEDAEAAERGPRVQDIPID
jgi:hypothetical protein